MSTWYPIIFLLGHTFGQLPGEWTLGQATYHDFSGTTACGIPDSDQYILSHSPSFPYGYIAAMSVDTFNEGTACGGCFEIQCIGSWEESNIDCTCNASVDSITIQAVDLSGTFDPPHFDISTNAWNTFTNVCGKINITYRSVACEFTQNIKIITLQNDAWWFGLRVENVAGYGQLCAIGIKSSGSNAYIACQNQASQWFCDDASLEPTNLPITVKLQTCDGVQIIAQDVITAYGINTFDFGANFPFTSVTNVSVTNTDSPTSYAITTATPSQSSKDTTNSPISTTAISPSEDINGNIIVHNFGSSLGVWWYVAYVSNVQSGYQVNTFEIQSSGSSTWERCNAVTVTITEYQCEASSDAYVFPLSVRLNSTNGEIITANDLITAYDDDLEFDFGDNFAGSNSVTYAPQTTQSSTELISSSMETNAPTIATKQRTTNESEEVNEPSLAVRLKPLNWRYSNDVLYCLMITHFILHL